MKRFFYFCGAVFLAWAGPLCAQTPAAEDHDLKIKEIHELLNLTHVEEIQKQMLKTMFVQLRSSESKVPESFWVKGENEMAQTLPDLNEKIIAIYDRHFSQKDLETIIAFYKTDTGQRFLAEVPKVSQESMAAGQAWGQSIGAQIDKELKAAGYE